MSSKLHTNVITAQGFPNIFYSQTIQLIGFDKVRQHLISFFHYSFFHKQMTDITDIPA
jgi:hypothetical protein